MTNSLVFTHFDTDGITSAQIARKIWGKDTPVIFQKWHKFGVDEEDYQLLASYKPKTVIVLDLGAETKTLENLNKFAEQDIPVWLVDNHPPEDKTILAKYASDNFNIASTRDNCTAGTLFSELGETTIKGDNDLRWAKIWAAIGIQGDIANETTQGKPMLASILATVPLLSAKILRWGKDNDTGGYKTIESDILPTISAYLNTPRRIARHYGAYTGLQMLDEIEKANDITLPEQDFNDAKMQALYPATSIVKRWKEEWYSNWTSVFKAENIRYWDMGKYTFSQVNHPWNLATQVANIKANDKERPKAHFCMNSYPVDGYITIGSRNPQGKKNPLDLGKLLVRVTELSNGKIAGGGLSMAASAHAPANTSVSEFLNYLNQAIDEFQVISEYA